jgi:hypothetical protein
LCCWRREGHLFLPLLLLLLLWLLLLLLQTFDLGFQGCHLLFMLLSKTSQFTLMPHFRQGQRI